MINNKKLLFLYKETLRIRLIELEISKKYKEQKMRCPVHLSLGQESVPVAICSNLKKEDQLVTAHRSHAHYLAKGGDLKKMMAELYGKVEGCAKGRGGSMHLIDHKSNINAAVPIVGSTLPIGVGLAWAKKLRKLNDVVVIFFGDGATEEGVFLESIDFASLHDLKVLFVCENNKFSVYSHIKKRQNKNRSITKIANSVGISSSYFQDHNILKIFTSTKKIINSIKKKSRPYLIEVNTSRYLEHCGPNNDDFLNYRSKKNINFWKKKDQISFLEKVLIKKKILNQNLKNKIFFKINKEINFAFAFSERAKFPNYNNLMDFIYNEK
jgi:TPP-dependent pyruvate/acetoin dehydrogenase alpha subunit